ncbi:class II aldolase/adducin family protein [Streptomyces cadmiisoli]|uniref:class II aldolase/adducin family protein n=1 Tax=Streptomyces cadmiisoli TaxID=2184053 RepID=UPI003D755F0A
MTRRQVWLTPPVFGDPAEERRYRKTHLTAALRIFGSLGYDEGIAGHLSVRDPERPDHFWVNPFGVAFGKVRLDDLILVSPDGDVIEGDRPVNHSGWVLHNAILRARPDVISVVHAHSAHGKAWSALGRLLDPLTQDACVFHRDHALIKFNGLLRTPAQGQEVAGGLGSCKAAILQNHGLLTVGAGIDEAAWWFVAMDRACHVQLMAEAAGEVTRVPEDLAESAGAGPVTDRSRLYGWASFQPMVEAVLEDAPEMLLPRPRKG